MMGITIEFNPDLALRDIEHFKKGERAQEECLPENIEEGQTYNFLKKDQRNYWLHGELALLETKGNQQLSRPLASIVIIEATHFMKNGEVWTKGKYIVKEVFDRNDPTIQFEWMERIGRNKQ
ncbi:hypothetical protein HON15_05520 [Candidatus Woesearchaeota archaeon]|jgi:hypothetical protein|nr:hypothetical protein [Candidatus Woesearchaeota archaeon]